jgi:hypothetical protein
MTRGDLSRQRVRKLIGGQVVSPAAPHAILVRAGGISASNCLLSVVKTDGHSIPTTRRGTRTIWQINAYVSSREAGVWVDKIKLACKIRDILNGKPLTIEIMKMINQSKDKDKLIGLLCLRSLP